MIDELYSGTVIEQTFKITKDVSIAHVRPWVYLEGTLSDGELELTIVQDGTDLLTITVDYTEINTAKTESFAHGFLRVDFDNLILHLDETEVEQEYVLKYRMVNHTTDTNNFIGLVRQWENKIYATYGVGVIGNEAPNDSVEPFGFELYEYKVRR